MARKVDEIKKRLRNFRYVSVSFACWGREGCEMKNLSICVTRGMEKGVKIDRFFLSKEWKSF